MPSQSTSTVTARVIFELECGEWEIGAVSTSGSMIMSHPVTGKFPGFPLQIGKGNTVKCKVLSYSSPSVGPGACLLYTSDAADE